MVLQLLSGEQSMAELYRKVTSQMIGSLEQQFLAATSRAFERDADRSAEQERIVELERMVGKLTMQLEIAKKASTWRDGAPARNGRWL